MKLFNSYLHPLTVGELPLVMDAIAMCTNILISLPILNGFHPNKCVEFVSLVGKDHIIHIIHESRFFFLHCEKYHAVYVHGSLLTSCGSEQSLCHGALVLLE